MAQDDDITAALPRGSFRPEASWPTFAEYEVLDRIGGGGFGGVFRCQRTGGGGFVAIKVPYDDPVSIELFDRELDLLLRLPPHPNVVGVVARTEAKLPSGRRLKALVMEWVREARTIDEFASMRRLSTRERLSVLSSVASGLDHLHMNGVVHRDFTPNNVLVGQDGRPVIVDLGGARERLDQREGHSVATIAYASPEQIDGTDPRTIDQGSDIYSFGKLIAAVLMGREIHRIPGAPTRPESEEFARRWNIEHYQSHPRWPGRRVAELIAEMTEHDRARRVIRADRVKERLDQIVRPISLKVEQGVRRVVGNRHVRRIVATAVSALGGVALAVLLLDAYARLGSGPKLVFPPRTLEALTDVVIVDVVNPNAIQAAAQRLKPPANTSSGAERRRHLFAEVIRRSSELGASCVVIDAALPINPDALGGTRAMVEAMLATGGRLPVITGVSEEWTTQPDERILAPELMPLVRDVGAMEMTQVNDAHDRFHVGFLREGHRLSLSLATAGAAAHLRATAEIEPRWLSLGVGDLVFRTPWPANGVNAPRRTELDWVGRYGSLAGDTVKPGPEEGDLTGIITVDPWTVEQLCQEHAIPIHHFLDPSQTERLRERVARKLVLVWQGEDGKDLIPVVEGAPKRLPGGWRQAVAIQSLLSLPAPWPSTEMLTMLLLCAALAGAIAAGWLSRPNRRWPASQRTLLAAMVGGALLLALIGWILLRPASIDFRAAFIVLALLGGAVCRVMLRILSAVVSDASMARSSTFQP